MNQYLIWALALLISYILGSVSPAYILGRLLKHLDIREVGTKNAGATNVYKILGLWPAVICASYDLLKGLGAIAIAFYLLHTPVWLAYTAGLTAIFGHIFPFYLRFRGGEGSATGVGILFYFIAVVLKNHIFPWELFVLVMFLAAVFSFVAREKHIIGIITLTAFIFFILTRSQLTLETLNILIILALLMVNTVRESLREDVFALKIKTKKDVLVWRTILRPLAILLPLSYFLWDKKIVLLIIGAVAGVFVLVDLVRLMASRVNIFLFKLPIFKQKEVKRFSSMSSFLCACFLVVLIFERNIAINALAFLVFGDVAAKFFGLQFGKIKIGEKSLEGSMAYFATCIFCGTALLPFAPISFWQILTGAAVASVTEVLPWKIDDNFSVGIATAAGMQLVSYLGG